MKCSSPTSPSARAARSRLPRPQGVDENTVLSWRPGREAASHQVYFGTDANAVRNGTAAVQTVTDHRFDPGPLKFGQTYYWKVAEVNEAATPQIWEGDVWSFSTREALAVDDFESYTDDDNRRLRYLDRWPDQWQQRLDGRLLQRAVRGADDCPRRQAVDAAGLQQHQVALSTARPSGRSTRPRTGRSTGPIR